MTRKRLRIAQLGTALGLHRVMRRGSAARLLVLNYHRLRPAANAPTRFDDGVFDTDVGTFRRQMEWLRANTVILDEDGLLGLGSRDGWREGTTYSAVTFDDGYIDCSTLAKSVLDEIGIRGIFFIPFEMIDSQRLGWWDLAANLLKKTARKSITVEGESFDLRGDFAGALRRILGRFKLEPAGSTATLLDRLAIACDVSLATAEEQSAELMTWAQVRELRAAGHAIGAHSLTHRVLATLDPAAQAREIEGSRRELEAVLGCRTLSFAYPVGGPGHIDRHSVSLARQAGYAQAFTFNTGIATLPMADPFQVPRESAKTMAMLQCKALLPGVMGLYKGLPVL